MPISDEQDMLKTSLDNVFNHYCECLACMALSNINLMCYSATNAILPCKSKLCANDVHNRCKCARLWNYLKQQSHALLYIRNWAYKHTRALIFLLQHKLRASIIFCPLHTNNAHGLSNLSNTHLLSNCLDTAPPADRHHSIANACSRRYLLRWFALFVCEHHTNNSPSDNDVVYRSNWNCCA